MRAAFCQEIVNGFGNLFDYLHKKKARLTYWQVSPSRARVLNPNFLFLLPPTPFISAL